MIPISGCLIVQNEEKYIEKAIKNIKPNVGEIVIVDGGSTDNTVKIAKDLGCKVFFRDFDFNFSNQRNFAMSCCQNDWVLWLDADEYYDENFFNILPTLVMNKSERIKAYQVFRISKFDDEIVGRDYQWRVLNKKYCCWQGKVHEGVDLGKKDGAQLPKEFMLYHEHSMNRQRYNSALYQNIANGKKEHPADNIGMEYHEDKGGWIVVETERNG